MDNVLRIPIRIDLGDGTPPIAMVDDEKLDHEIVERFHRRSGLRNPLVHFADGMAFFAYLDEVDAGLAPLPAVVLMDINMPRMNGFETVEALRSRERFRDVPIVLMLTSSDDLRDKEQALAAGADGYLLKPYDPRRYLDLFLSLDAA